MKILLFFLPRGLISFLIGFILCRIIRLSLFNDLINKSNSDRELMISVLTGYIIMLMVFMFTPNYIISGSGIDLTSENFDFVGNFKDRINTGYWGINLIPFATIRSYIKYSGIFHALLNILGNVVLFIPIGFIFPLILIRYRDLKRIAVLSISISLFIEFIQFFVGRSCDIDDLILNFVGGIIGYTIFCFASDKLKFILGR